MKNFNLSVVLLSLMLFGQMTFAASEFVEQCQSHNRVTKPSCMKSTQNGRSYTLTNDCNLFRYYHIDVKNGGDFGVTVTGGSSHSGTIGQNFWKNNSLRGTDCCKEDPYGATYSCEPDPPAN